MYDFIVHFINLMNKVRYYLDVLRSLLLNSILYLEINRQAYFICDQAASKRGQESAAKP